MYQMTYSGYARRVYTIYLVAYNLKAKRGSLYYTKFVFGGYTKSGLYNIPSD